MRVMIVGQRWLGVEAMQLCLSRGDDIVSVAVPGEADRLAVAAKAAGLPVTAGRARIEAADVPVGVDVIICAHAHVYLTAGARAAARLGAIGYHPSLLPLHRGRDATRWAIHMRERVTGGTVYWMNDTADAGPVAAQAWCLIRPDDTPESLWRRELGPMGLRLLAAVLADLDAGRVVAMEQDQELATWEPAWSKRQLSEV